MKIESVPTGTMTYASAMDRAAPPSLTDMITTGATTTTLQIHPRASFVFSSKEMRDFIQANVETTVKQNEEQSKRAIPGVTKI
jgi:hypothetical protein